MATLKERDAPPLSIRGQLRWDVVRPIVERVKPHRTIEVGTGQGAVGARLAVMTSGSYVGVELDEMSCARAQARIGPHGGVVHCLPLATVAPEPADLLCAFEVLEHIDDDEGALAEWISCLSPGGHLVLSVPAHEDRYGAMDAYVGHYRRYSPRKLTEMAEALGLTDVHATLYGAPLGYGLEAVRNRIDAKKIRQVQGETPEALTAASGRTFQFERRSWKSLVATAGTTPFRYLQRVWPGGVGIVLDAQKPV